MLTFLLSIISVFSTNGQYADLGNGNLKNSIWWVDFHGFRVADGASKSFTTPSGLKVTILFSNVSGVIPTPNGLNTWPGAVLQTGYNFSNPNIKPALLTPMVSTQTQFVVTVSATRDGKDSPVNFIVADAEASAVGEQIRLQTSGTPWQMIDFLRNSDQTTNPFVNCGTNSAYIYQTIDESAYPDHKGQVPIVMTQSAGVPISVQIIYDKQPPHGASAVAMGILEAVDMGDLPSSYGIAQHKIDYSVLNPCNYNPPLPSLKESDKLLIGKVPGDADANDITDDNAIGVDEDGLSTFPFYDKSGTYTLNIPVKNFTGKTAYFSGWFDFNRDGKFTDNEKISVSVSAGATSVSIKWTGLPTDLLSTNSPAFAFRFRISSDQNAISEPDGFASDGEVEDYFEKINNPQGDYLIINDYAAVSNYELCFNELTLDNAAAFKAGDTVLLIQMKGAVIDLSNTATFGTVTNYNNSGNYEFNIIKSKDGNKVRSLNELIHSYDFANGKVQLVRVPYYSSCTNNKILTATPWDGNKGGILALNVSGTFTMNQDIDVSRKGFRHGDALQNTAIASNAAGYFYNAASNNGGEKGEGISVLSSDMLYGRGALANGGGGGNAHNAGGGGGGNGGQGGEGGDQYDQLKTLAESIGGKGGKALVNDAGLNRLFLGGAGGMGQANDKAEFLAGNGGGIIIISAGNLVSNGHFILANGENATEAPTANESKDGMPGGGAGGTVLLNINTASSPTKIEAKGGNGADQISTDFNGKFGPGGGGGGGIVAVSQVAMSGQFSVDISGGINGVNTGYGNDPWGATPGQNGKIITNFAIATSTKEFKGSFELINLSAVQSDCQLYNFTADALPSNSLVANWEWDFGDGQTGNTQNTSHNFGTEGTFNVKLKLTSTDGCQDSVLKQITTYSDKIDVSDDVAVCENNSVQLTASGGQSYSWTPSTGLNDATVSNPTASPLTTTTYTVSVQKAPNCTVKGNVKVTVNPKPVVKISNDTTICIGSTIPIFASGGTQYQWTAGDGISNPDIANPTVTPTRESSYHVVVTDGLGCNAEGDVNVFLFAPEKIQATANTEVCKDATVQLSTTGGNSFSWTPANLITNSTGNTATTLPLPATTKFYVDITDQHACISRDSVEIKVRPEAIFSISDNQKVCEQTEVTLSAQGGDHYQWNPMASMSDPNSATVIVAPDKTTTFSLIITENTCGKTETLYTTVEVLPLPNVRATSSSTPTCAKPFTQLHAIGSAIKYNWEPSESLDNPGISDPIGHPLTNTTYTVTGTDSNGCKSSAIVVVTVDFADPAFVGMPNAFTPNGDGLNDCFGLKSFGQIDDFEFRVYNRFGQLVFQTNDARYCWDGTLKGEPQNTGTYVYTVKGKTVCQIINLKGIVSLIR